MPGPAARAGPATASSARRGPPGQAKAVYPAGQERPPDREAGCARARAWAAPRVERAGEALQERIAPKVSAMWSPPRAGCNRPRRPPPPLAEDPGWDLMLPSAALPRPSCAAGVGRAHSRAGCLRARPCGARGPPGGQQSGRHGDRLTSTGRCARQTAACPGRLARGWPAASWPPP